VAEASTAAEAVEAALTHRPEVCILAVRIPGSGIDAARRVREALPQTKIVMLADVERDDDLISALRAGADGYLLVETSSARLPHAIRAVVDGEAVLSRRLTAHLIREFRDHGRPRRLTVSVADHGVEVTSREFEVLESLRSGESTAEIANRLGISAVTVRRHISAILRKLGMPDRRAAIELFERVAQEEGAPPTALAANCVPRASTEASAVRVHV
jgi:DNA-binding NarL/FixJ family response regulator